MNADVINEQGELIPGPDWTLNNGTQPVVDGTAVDIIYSDLVVAYGIYVGLPADCQQLGQERSAMHWGLDSQDKTNILLWRLCI
jgi:hypothetical protein